MTLMVWSFQTVRVFFLIKSLFVVIWQQFLKILKVEKSLILRDFRGAKSDIKFEFYEETEYSCAVTPQVRQTGNRLSGLAGTAYASLLT